MGVTGRDDLTARLLRHRTAELEEYKRAALSRDMSPEFVAEFESLKQQLAGAVGAEVERVLKDDEAMRRAVRAHERSAVGGRTAMTRAIRAAFGGH